MTREQFLAGVEFKFNVADVHTYSYDPAGMIVSHLYSRGTKIKTDYHCNVLLTDLNKYTFKWFTQVMGKHVKGSTRYGNLVAFTHEEVTEEA